MIRNKNVYTVLDTMEKIVLKNIGVPSKTKKKYNTFKMEKRLIIICKFT